MRTGPSNPVVPQTMKIKRVLIEITRARAGSASIVDAAGRLAGIFTDGDLRRHLELDASILERPVQEVMTRKPKVIHRDRLAAEALQLLRSKKLDELPVIDNRHHPVGLLDVQDLLKAGLV